MEFSDFDKDAVKYEMEAIYLQYKKVNMKIIKTASASQPVINAAVEALNNA